MSLSSDKIVKRLQDYQVQLNRIDAQFLENVEGMYGAVAKQTLLAFLNELRTFLSKNGLKTENLGFPLDLPDYQLSTGYRQHIKSIYLPKLESLVSKIAKFPEMITPVSENDRPGLPNVEIPASTGNKTKGGVPRFPFVTNTKLRDILRRDWKEINSNLEHKNWKSVLILCGGVLEALLLDVLLRQREDAKESKDKLRESDSDISRGSTITRWNLYTLIEVATDLKLITEVGKGFGSALRNYRNLVHPYKEAKGNYTVRDNEAIASFETLKAIVKDLKEALR